MSDQLTYLCPFCQRIGKFILTTPTSGSFKGRKIVICPNERCHYLSNLEHAESCLRSAGEG
jgi:hypothetical protein